ncbi:MAG: lanthionine synthetase LanC family protein, partial [Bacillota bacterium]
GGKEYLDAAAEAIAYENTVFDKEYSNWPDYRIDRRKRESSNLHLSLGNHKKFMNGYCSGAPGVGLSRLGLLKSAERNPDLAKTLDRDLKRSEHFVKEVSTEIRDQLCCGRISGIDFLIEKAVRLGDEEAMAFAKEKMSLLILEKRVRGHYNLINSDGHYRKNPTLFQGTSGIGYEMLRIAEPEIIKSILI